MAYQVVHDYGYIDAVWDGCLARIGNEIGTAALLGNLYAESYIVPWEVQGDIPPSQYSRDYTARVDSGAVSEYDFAHNGPRGNGYGLAQWTYYTRKQGLYDLYKTGYDSIGSTKLGIDYLFVELDGGYTGVLDALKNATDIRTASDIVLHDYESPSDQSEQVEILRASYAQDIYNNKAGGTPPDPPDPPDPPEPPVRDKHKFKYYYYCKRRRIWTKR